MRTRAGSPASLIVPSVSVLPLLRQVLRLLRQQLCNGLPRAPAARAPQRLEGAGEDRGPPKAAALELALAQAKPLAQSHACCDLRERSLVHERRAQARQVAFGKLGKTLVQECRDRAVEQAVAEEFE